MTAGLWQHFRLTLRLNLRSPRALVYGYIVPIFFLLAFGSVFRSGVPPLMREMGQLITISTLGGACFGMPTALVAERERGVWRRYRLLPVSLGGLVAGTMLARFLIIASAAVMQIALARGIYGTPFPAHPLQLLIAFTFVAFAFLGLGLVIAALADNVPAVQALGQAIFLPMIMIGGVGVPLRSLPAWAQQVAGFFPGRYAVESLQPCFNGNGLHHATFGLIALTIIGLAACVAGAKLFRWDAGSHVSRASWAWVAVAVCAGFAVGFTARSTGHLRPVPNLAGPLAGEPYESITEAQINSITFTDLNADDDTVTPLAHSLDSLSDEDRQRLANIRAKLDAWPPAHDGPDAQRVRNILSVAAIADYTQDPLEGQIARVVFDRLQADFDKELLTRILTWIILHPEQGAAITSAPELDLQGRVNEDVLRDRAMLYAKKLLGRLVGKIVD
ncbi:MAG TPA: ABC transporter permease [Tepidisphaeraceae bacterium]|nr:ABC transporter permease [Tepidisphaeraceae bacterium]